MSVGGAHYERVSLRAKAFIASPGFLKNLQQKRHGSIAVIIIKFENQSLTGRNMETRIVDREITLIPYYPNSEVTLSWYQDPGVCKQVDNIDHVYDLELLNRMYTFLSAHGDCYYIQYNGTLVGDVSLRDNAEICIVVSKEYQNKHIGRRCVVDMIALAKAKEMKEVRANIYSFNTQSQRMFQSAGFKKVSEEWFLYRIESD